MLKTYDIKNQIGNFKITIDLTGVSDCLIVSGNKKACIYEFKKINKKSPNNYGNFYKREKAGRDACLEILKNYKLF